MGLRSPLKPFWTKCAVKHRGMLRHGSRKENLLRALCLLAITSILAAQTSAPTSVASRPTSARAANGNYISWREHIIDDESRGGVAIRGGDGLKLADLDKDGNL